MTGTTIPVRAQWALHGKVLDDEGYQVIACSNGDLSKANFTDALGRFALGALDTLPQVSVSYLQPAASVSGGGYLALAIHWSAGNGKRHAAGVGHVDNQGRPTTFTSYFCAPYATLAGHRITYLDMYKAFGEVTLPTKDGPPKDLLIVPAAQRTPGIDALAMRVAPLLLTGAPVCVLGADETSVDERLRFIDTVMGLLPYGYRARMTAATWTRATNRTHRFRLFFSSEPRAGDKPDEVVHWGEPERVKIPSKDARAYYSWLNDKIKPLAGLTQLNRELGFGDAADSRTLDMVLRFSRFPPGQAVPEPPPAHDPPRVRAAAPAADPVPRLLEECAEHARSLSLNLVHQDIADLQGQLKSSRIDDKHRERYRVLIGQLGLLNLNSGLQRNNESKLYETLLALAFGQPVTYAVLGQIEDCLGNPPRRVVHRPLLEAIARVGLGDLRAKVIVSGELDPKKLLRSLGSSGADGHALIREVEQGSWHRQQHGRSFCDVTLSYLRDRQGRYSITELQRVLLRCGYLAQPLREIGSEQYQVHVIAKLLVAAFPLDRYPAGLDRAVVNAILTNPHYAPTPALLAAILRRIPVSEARAAWDAFVYGSVVGMNLDEETHGDLWLRLPSIEPEPPAAPPQQPQAAAPTGLGPEIVPLMESLATESIRAEQDRQWPERLKTWRPWAKQEADPEPWAGAEPDPGQRPWPREPDPQQLSWPNGESRPGRDTEPWPQQKTEAWPEREAEPWPGRQSESWSQPGPAARPGTATELDPPAWVNQDRRDRNG